MCLAYGGTKSGLVLIWFAAACAVAVADAWVFQRLRTDLSNARWRRLALVSLLLSTVTFAVIGPILYLTPSVVTEIGASMLMCAVSLNNTMMTRGWRGATYVVVGAVSAAMLIGAPIALMARHVHASPLDILVLVSANLSYLAFIAILIATLQRESDAVRSAQARWRSLFDQNPLPQLCLDASGLFQALDFDPKDNHVRQADVFRRTVHSIEILAAGIRVTEVNRAALRLLGADSAETFQLSAHFDGTFIEGFAASRSAPRTEDGFEPFDCPLIRGDGSTRSVKVHVHTVEIGSRGWATVILTLEDITELQRADAAQQQALVAAEQANRAKSDFLATMSHEIRTPLNGVLGMVQALERGTLTQDQRRQLAVIGRSGSALLVILNDILDLSKIEAGMLELDPTPFDLALLVAELSTPSAKSPTARGWP
jgi:signal transduction histidine kinase